MILGTYEFTLNLIKDGVDWDEALDIVQDHFNLDSFETNQILWELEANNEI